MTQGTTLAELAPVPSVPEAFALTLAKAFAARKGARFALMLSGGPTAAACYGAVAGLPEGTIDWPMVDIYMGDERYVPAEHPDANQRLVRETLIDRVAPVGSFTPIPTDGPPADCAQRYQAVVAALLRGGGIDMIHLGLGTDGHTASLFPGGPELDAGPEALVVVSRDPNGVNEHLRLTITYPVIAAARLVVFTVAGIAKRDALARVRRGADLPATRVRASRVCWIVDAAALGEGGLRSDR